MKTIVATLALTLAIAQPAIAETDKCSMIGEIAEHIMTYRQSNMPMSELMSVFAEVEGREIAEMMISDAYGYASYRTAEVRNDVIADFRNQWEHLCYTAQ